VRERDSHSEIKRKRVCLLERERVFISERKRERETDRQTEREREGEGKRERKCLLLRERERECVCSLEREIDIVAGICRPMLLLVAVECFFHFQLVLAFQANNSPSQTKDKNKKRICFFGKKIKTNIFKLKNTINI